MKIGCHHCDCVYNIDVDEWEEHKKEHMEKCEWFRVREEAD